MTPIEKSVILDVDDDPDVRAFVGHHLEKAGFRVVAAESGARCIEILNGQMPDLILMDVSMPKMNGYETCALIQRTMSPFLVPVIFLTASDSPHDRVKAVSVGAVDYLVKPIKADELLEAVRKHLVTKKRWTRLRARTAPPPKAPLAPAVAAVEAPVVGAVISELDRFKTVLADTLSLAKRERSDLSAAAGKDIYRAAAEHGMPETRLSRMIASFLDTEHLEHLDPTKIPLGVLPPSFCEKNLVCPIERPRGLVFVVANPFDDKLVHQLREACEGAKDVPLAVADPETILHAISGTLVAPPARQTERAAPIAHVAEKPAAATSVETLVDDVIEAALAARASDIHIEPWERKVVIRYRVDGELQIANILEPVTLIGAIANRVKVMSRLDVSEQRLPQDGHISYTSKTQAGQPFEVRVSILPSSYGETVVLRFLDLEASTMPLASVGFSPRHLALYLERIAFPSGLILHVGPAGSGKSTTSYAALNVMDKVSRNILTAEDPIENRIAGVTQVQINPEIGFTFAKALRSFLRQDPDVILVGELRDSETARTTVEAALAGHLVLSTLHTSDVATALTRLVELGVEPALVGRSVTLLCAQRLLRRLCLRCRTAYTPTAKERLEVGVPEDGDALLFRCVGCPACGQTGYRGRIATHELLVLDDWIREILSRPGCNALDLERAVTAAGMTTLYGDAMEKVRAGITSVAEVVAKLRPDQLRNRPAVDGVNGTHAPLSIRT